MCEIKLISELFIINGKMKQNHFHYENISAIYSWCLLWKWTND